MGTETLPGLGTVAVPERHPPCIKGKLRPRVSLRVTEQCSKAWIRTQLTVPNLVALNPFPRQHFATSQGAGRPGQITCVPNKHFPDMGPWACGLISSRSNLRLLCAQGG